MRVDYHTLEDFSTGCRFLIVRSWLLCGRPLLVLTRVASLGFFTISTVELSKNRIIGPFANFLPVQNVDAVAIPGSPLRWHLPDRRS